MRICSLPHGGSRNGNIRARKVRLLNPVPQERYEGVVCSMKDTFGFIERSDVVKEIFFHYSEYQGAIEELLLGDDVDFCVQTRNVSRIGVIQSFYVMKEYHSKFILKWLKRMHLHKNVSVKFFAIMIGSRHFFNLVQNMNRPKTKSSKNKKVISIGIPPTCFI